MQNKFKETGRSMVEMLGVLAIIGVLSVAGVATYQYALTAYQAGKVQDAFGKAKILAQTDSRASHALEVNRFIKSALPEHTPDDKKSMVKLIDGNYQVTAFKVAYKVCEKLLQKESILNDMGISILTRMCGNSNSKTNMVFSFNATPTFVSDSHFDGGNNAGNGENLGGSTGTGGSGTESSNNEPQSCPDKMVWREIINADGISEGYGCVCRHEYEFGDNCERCYPPRQWESGVCACPTVCPKNQSQNYDDCSCYCDPDVYLETPAGDGTCICKTEDVVAMELSSYAPNGAYGCRITIADLGYLKGTYYFEWVNGYHIFDVRLGYNELSNCWGLHLMADSVDLGHLVYAQELGFCIDGLEAGLSTASVMREKLKTIPPKYFKLDGTKQITVQFWDTYCYDNDGTMELKLHKIVDYCDIES